MLTSRRAWSAWLVSRGVVIVMGVVLGLTVHARNTFAFDLRNDVGRNYFEAARHMVHGAVPYLDFHYEYPPGSLPFVGLDWLLGGHTETSYLVIWVLLMVALDALVTATLLRHAALGSPAAIIWIAGGLALFPVFVRNDLIATTAFVLAFFATFGARQVTAGALWCFGFVAKLWPGPPLLALLLGRSAGRARLAFGAAGVGAAFAVPLATAGAWHPMTTYLGSYQGHRPVEVESTWATVEWLHALVTGTRLHPHYSFGSLNFTSPRADQLAATAHAVTLLVLVLTVLGPLALRMITGRSPGTAAWAWLFATSVALSLLVSSVLSPQYLIWLLGASCVVAALDPGRRANTLAATCLAAAALSSVIFPFLWTQLSHGAWTAIAVLVLRNGLLVAATVICGLGARDSLRVTSPARPADAVEPALLH